MRSIFLPFLLIMLISDGCFIQKGKGASSPSSQVKTVAQMRKVMWDGELFGKLNLDTLNKKGLYGVGPLAYLQGELLINNGEVFVSKVIDKNLMEVYESSKVKAPFFVYANVDKFYSIRWNENIKTITDLETLLGKIFKEYNEPFVVKLKGKIKKAQIHIQNLPDGAVVNSPEEAHSGQVKYQLQNEVVEIIGFYSQNHQGVFTHHDTFLHLHLITVDKTMMGHLDTIEFGEMELMVSEKEPKQTEVFR